MPPVGVREALRANSSKTTVVATGAVGILLLVVAWELMGGSDSVLPGSSVGKAFFTDDDGKTTFVDEATKTPPFEHNGKEAVRVQMFRCGSTKFIGYLGRYSRESLAALEKARHDPHFEPRAFASIRPDVKRAMKGTWVSQGSAEGQKIRDVKCPDGKGEVEPVIP
jgi:hypothetical protein